MIYFDVEPGKVKIVPGCFNGTFVYPGGLNLQRQTWVGLAADVTNGSADPIPVTIWIHDGQDGQFLGVKKAEYIVHPSQGAVNFPVVGTAGGVFDFSVDNRQGKQAISVLVKFEMIPV